MLEILQVTYLKEREPGPKQRKHYQRTQALNNILSFACLPTYARTIPLALATTYLLLEFDTN